MKINALLSAGLLGLGWMLGLGSAPCDAKERDPRPREESVVQLALLLDTSNSMDGLISQAKSQLWRVVNEFNGARQHGRQTVVEVALYEYGNNSLSAGTNYVWQVLPLTRDLDAVSEALFKLTTNGGEEYCGAVIREALDKLSWDKDANTYKAVFIAGNEPFRQGPIEPEKVCRSAIGKGVVINTIHCGDARQGQESGWEMGARVAEGKFMTINQDQAVVHIPAPQDEEITKLSTDLNKTYIGYGNAAPAAAAKQMAQDANSSSLKAEGAAVQRALTKASANYCNTGWDLVDAQQRGGVKLEEIKEADLPAEMKSMSLVERKAYVDAKAAERLKIQARIKELNEQRLKFIAERESRAVGEKTLDQAICLAVREQASAREIEFDQ